MTARETSPEIVRLTEQYPFEVISVAGSIADHYSMAQMTDILNDDALINAAVEATAEGKAHFASLQKKGYEAVKDKQTKQELARSAFMYIADVRALWYRGARDDLRESA
jgi:hypothetical protein